MTNETTTTTAAAPTAAAATIEVTSTTATAESGAATTTTTTTTTRTTTTSSATVVDIPADTAAAAPAAEATAATTSTAITETREVTSTETTTAAKKAVDDEEEHIKSSCCCCVEIRAGVLFLLGLGFVMNFITLVMSIGKYDTSVLSMTFNGLNILFSAWGLWAAANRHAGSFSAFALVNVALVFLGIIVVFFMTGPLLLLIGVFFILPGYFAYVYLQYAKVLKFEKDKEVAEKAVAA
ncbi:hypothetical protein H9P43_005068 [Blastocladiella emersonii ATCC 22665]|nr:hypothetical protein H9P43_005068 [Blastocladiella emersonii ATCC 22665]